MGIRIIIDTLFIWVGTMGGAGNKLNSIWIHNLLIRTVEHDIHIFMMKTRVKHYYDIIKMDQLVTIEYCYAYKCAVRFIFAT